MKDRIKILMKTLMESQHMTQQVFADFIGINPATLSGLFNDRTKPTINIVEAVKKKFPDISLDWLMFGTGSMYLSAATETSTPPPAVPPPTSARVQSQHTQTSTSEPVLDFGEPPAPAAATSPAVQAAPAPRSQYNIARNPRAELIREEVKNIDNRNRRVTEIRVFYDDQTWESFVPAKKS